MRTIKVLLVIASIFCLYGSLSAGQKSDSKGSSGSELKKEFSKADIEDARVEQLVKKVWEQQSQWINVMDFGVSGSQLETTAATIAGSKKIVVNNPEGFKVGQGVMISKCDPHYIRKELRGLTGMYERVKIPFDEVVELRGFDGSGGDWLIFILDIRSDNPYTFRWSDDLALSWKGTDVPITWDWQKLSGGMEIKFKKRDMEPGMVINFTARTQLRTTIEKIEGNNVWLKDAPSRSVNGAIMRHNDTDALRAALKSAQEANKNLFIPKGYYRIDEGLTIENTNITIEGENPEHTIFDISDGVGAVFRLRMGRDITIRNLTLIGHTGLEEKAGTMSNIKNFPFWCSALKSCQAVAIENTERVLIENVHAKRMAAEAFYCQGSSRRNGEVPDIYTKSLTFRRCSVIDCAANAFNNNDTSENTTVEYCRIDGAGWHAYEGPGRFIRLIGNYVRNAGSFTIGDMSHRDEDLNELGCGQAIIRDNVFESGGRCAGILVNHGSRQVCIANNLFINYNGNAITVSGRTVRTSYPSKNMTITGNIIDLSYRGENQAARTGIKIDASHVIASDNQIYVRGDRINETTGISISEGIEDVIVHDNLILNCGAGLNANRRESSVATVLNTQTFTDTQIPLEWQISSRYQGWNIVWLADNMLSTISDFDPDKLQFTLEKPKTDLKTGDSFHLFPPQARWDIHDNTITDCWKPVKIDVYGSATTTLRNNLIARGHAADANTACQIAGQVNLIGNHFEGFDASGCIALELIPDKQGRILPNQVRDNVFQNCALPVIERKAGLWNACSREGNLYSATDLGTLKPLTAARTVLLK
jgi:hypothetical protein